MNQLACLRHAHVFARSFTHLSRVPPILGASSNVWLAGSCRIIPESRNYSRKIETNNFPEQPKSSFDTSSRKVETSQFSKKKPIWERLNTRENKLALMLIAVVGTYWIVKSEYDNKYYPTEVDPIIVQDSPVLLARPPECQIARSIRNVNDRSSLKLTLYQYQTCPFCCKLRAFLDYYGFSYDVVEVNSITRRQTKWSGYKKVPFLLAEVQGKEEEEPQLFQLKDSSAIISILSSLLRNPTEQLPSLVAAYPAHWGGDKRLHFTNTFVVMAHFGDEELSQKEQKKITREQEWRRWVDEDFVHTLSPNVYRTYDEALQAFHWFSEVGDWERLFPTWERLLVVYAGAAVMYFIGKKLKQKYKLGKDPRAALFSGAFKWTQAVKRHGAGGEFLGGAMPNLADLSMYGVLTAIEGCDAFKELIDQTNIGGWFYSMKKHVKQSRGDLVLLERFGN